MDGEYTATCTRNGDWWAIDVTDVPAGHTQAANVEQIPFMAAATVEQLTGRTMRRLRLTGPEVARALREQPPTTSGAALDDALRVGFIDPTDTALTDEIARHGVWSWSVDGDDVVCQRN